MKTEGMRWRLISKTESENSEEYVDILEGLQVQELGVLIRSTVGVMNVHSSSVCFIHHATLKKTKKRIQKEDAETANDIHFPDPNCFYWELKSAFPDYPGDDKDND